MQARALYCQHQSQLAVFLNASRIYNKVVDCNKIEHNTCCKIAHSLIPLLTLIVLCWHTGVPFLSMSFSRLHEARKSQMTSPNLPIH